MDKPIRYSRLENGALFAAIIVLGVMAGFFWTYTFNVNRAMLAVDGKTYAELQSLFNVHVRHAMFFAFFFGGGFITILALAINYKHRKRKDFYLLLVASLIYVFAVIVYTHQVNLPLNYYTESWDANKLPSDWYLIRQQWNTANAFRTAAAFTAFVLAACALLVRASPANFSQRTPGDRS